MFKSVRALQAALLFVVLWLIAGSCLAQQPAARLQGPIGEGNRRALAGSETPWARPEVDRGAVAPGTMVRGITLIFGHTAAQEADLQGLMAAQRNAASPEFRQWLTPAQFASRFGVADADLRTVRTWLEQQGFAVDEIGSARDRITFSGTAAQVHEAFGTSLHRYAIAGAVHMAPDSAVSLPGDLAGMVVHVGHLNDLRPKSNLRVSRPRDSTQAKPEYTTTATQAHYLAPGDVATMYDVAPLYKQGFNGNGQSIAVVGQSFVHTGVLQSFATYTQGNAQPALVLVPNSGNEAVSYGDEGESDLDLEYADAMAPQVKLYFVYTGSNPNYDAFDALSYAVVTDIAQVISSSYSACEPLLSASFLSASNQVFEQAAVQGQTIVAASGDSGSTACVDFIGDGLTTAQLQAPAVSFPADSPLVIGVGGTQMIAGSFAAGANQYWQSAPASTGALGGALESSLLSYVPETVWNEDSASVGIGSSGGGASTLYTRPSWQSSLPGIPAGTARLVPDIALQASFSDPGYVFCTDDPTLVGTGQDCSNGLLGSGNLPIAGGGTSFAAPIFAGMISVLNQAVHGAAQGVVGPTLYSLASNATTYAKVFHDVTAGSNACTAGPAFCSGAATTEFAAVAGFDEATGLGSVDLNALVGAWPVPAAGSQAAKYATYTNASAVISNLSAGAPASIAVQVGAITTGGVVADTPTGTLTVSVDGVPVQTSLALTSTNITPGNPGSATYTYVAPATSGPHVLTFAYSGDAANAPSQGSVAITVGTLTPSGSFTLSASNLTLQNGGSGTSTVTVTPAGGYSGSVSWSLTIKANSTTTSQLSACYNYGTLRVNGTSMGQVQLGTGAACNVASLNNGDWRDISPDAGSLDGLNGQGGPGAPYRVAECALLLGALGWGWSRRRRGVRLPFLAACVMVLTLFGVSGCGGKTTSSAPASPTPTGPSSYTVTLQGTDTVNTSITASTTFQLTVE